MLPRAPIRRPLVTVVVAAYDAGEYIGAALASLCRQTVDDIEVVVVDDGSTDSTSRTVQLAARRDGRVRLVRLRQNRGQAAALNVGAEQARGRYLAILDADDVATPARLAHQLASLEKDRGLVLVGGAVEPFCDRYRAAGKVWRYASDDASIRVMSLFRSEFISGAMTFDREQLVKHHLRFDERRRLGADWAMSIEAMRVGRVANVDRVIMRYRIHPGQLTTQMMDDVTSDSARIRREALAWLGVRPTDEELRTHLAISPCNYWPFGAHPYFRERRASIAREAGRWFDRLRTAAALTGRVSTTALSAFLDELAALIAERLSTSDEAPRQDAPYCPVAYPRACVAERLPLALGCRATAERPRRPGPGLHLTTSRTAPPKPTASTKRTT